MQEDQSEGYGTAKALLDAGNIAGAKRIAGNILQKRPDDFGAADLMAEALLKEEDAKAALAFAADWLSRHPDFIRMHVCRFQALAKLNRKREMAASLEKFKANFPHRQDAIFAMELMLNARKGNANTIRQRLEEEIGETGSPDLIKTKGIALHNLNDLFEADYYLKQALEHDPADPEVLVAMATNRFQLGRLASARHFAARALVADPTQRRMAFLSRVSWLFYYPGFYILLVCFSLGIFLWARMNRLAAFAAFLAIIWAVRSSVTVFFFPLLILGGIGTTRANLVFFALGAASYFISVFDEYYQKTFGRKRPVTLKRY